MKGYLCIVVLIFVYSCGESEKTEKVILGEIKSVEDSLSNMRTSKTLDSDAYKKTQESYIKKLLFHYKSYPNSTKAPGSLDKVQIIYSEMGVYYLSSQWADTLINRYPKYKSRALVLESQANIHDVFMQPRDSSKVRLYYSILLNEFPSMEKEKREAIKRRLRYNNLNFDEYIEFQLMN